MAQKYVPVPMRRLVRARAGERCEYCLIPEELALASHWVDHIVAEKHGGQTEEANLAFSCVLCNQHKGTDLASVDPATGQITPLFNPRRDSWASHFRLTGPQIEPLTPVGRVTVRLLQLNRADRVEERRLHLRLGAITPPAGPPPGPVKAPD
jgi:5-methylcytosine-specific restriction endonuclease McrA